MIVGYLSAAVKAASGLSLLSKVLIGLGLVGALLVAVDLRDKRIYRSGFDAAIAKIAAADERTVERARKARADLQACHAANQTWDQSTGRCQ